MSSNHPLTAVAVSGGADSLYTLVRLAGQGVPVMAVHGLFIPDEARPDTGPKTVTDAVSAPLAEACSRLGVPFHILDCRDRFMERVIRPFVQAYAEGRTPNPCALCNASIKFGLLREKSFALGAARLATGHYARTLDLGDEFLQDEPTETILLHDEQTSLPLSSGPSVQTALLQGADPAKDQSYFLGLVPQEYLEQCIFPLGPKRKAEVVQALADRGIAVPQPKESQEVCFIPGDDYRNFLPAMAERLGIELPGPGPVLLADGSPLGNHQGLWRYTQGQRRGIGIGWKEPLHVLAKEREANVLRLGAKEEISVTGCLCTDLNILLPPEYWPETVYVKTRYRQRPGQAKVSIEDRPGGPALRVAFADPERFVAPGQLAAVYIPVPGLREMDGRRVMRLVAGGIIAEE